MWAFWVSAVSEWTSAYKMSNACGYSTLLPSAMYQFYPLFLILYLIQQLPSLINFIDHWRGHKNIEVKWISVKISTAEYFVCLFIFQYGVAYSCLFCFCSGLFCFVFWFQLGILQWGNEVKKVLFISSGLTSVVNSEKKNKVHYKGCSYFLSKQRENRRKTVNLTDLCAAYMLPSPGEPACSA